MTKYCLQCRRELNMPGIPQSIDCGGDCAECMAAADDPDARAKLSMPTEEPNGE